MFDALNQDLTFAIRVWRRNPFFVAVAIVSLAVSIGAASTVFSLANALLFRPLPGLHEPGRLADVGRLQDGQGFDTVSYPNYRDVRSRSRTFEDIYAWDVEPEPMSVRVDGDAERVYGTLVTGNYFSVLGTRPALGRLFEERDDEPVAARVAVISHALWQRRFASNPSIVGRTITVNGWPVAVVGVAPPRFHGTTLFATEMWLPISAVADTVPRLGAQMLRSRGSSWLMMAGRLKEGVRLPRANAELRAIAAGLQKEYPDINRGKGLAALPLSQVPGHVAPIAGFLSLLMGIALLLLLIACVNIAGVLLGRAEARRREIAVRFAIGAGRGRLVRQLLTETALLFAAGAVAGLITARWLGAALFALLPNLPFPVLVDNRTDWRVAAFLFVLALAATLVSGLAPAVHSARGVRISGLTARAGRQRLRRALIVGQVSASLLLLVVGALFVRAIQRADSVDCGFDARNIDVISIDLSLARLNEESGIAVVRNTLERVRAMPRVVTASAAADLPLDGSRMGLGPLKIPGIQPPSGRSSSQVDWNVVEPGFFRTLKVALLRGRDFAPTDTRASAPVVIVNNAFAQRFWPGQDPIGKHVLMQSVYDASRGDLTVVGVAADARLMSRAEVAEPYVYVPLAQQYLARTSLLVRTANGQSSIADVRRILRGINSNLPLSQATSLADVTAIDLVPQRIVATAGTMLGVVGLLLAALGLYGTMSYAVNRRAKEIGIRVALGARPLSIARMVLAEAVVVIGIGAVTGVVVAAAASRVLVSLLFGVSPVDGIAFGVACLLLALAGLAACYGPARRACTSDPVVALRSE